MNVQETIVIVTCFIFEIHRFRNCSEDFLFPLTYVIENMEDDDILDSQYQILFGKFLQMFGIATCMM